VCLATSGPGATNLVTGVATAYADSSPMMVLTGQVATAAIGNNAFQEADIFSLMMPITKHNYRVLKPDDLPEAIKRGMGIANSGRKGPVHIDLPVDVLRGDIDPARLNESFPVPAPFEDLSQVLDAAKLLRDAERPVLLVGGGARWSNASSEVQRLAEMLPAPVITTIMAKAIIPEDHPLSFGMLGMHGRECSRRALLEADVIFAIGARFSDRTIGYDSDVPKETKVIHLDIDPMEAGKNYRTKVRLVGDAKKGLQMVIKALGRPKGESAWGRRVKELHEGCECNIDIDEEPIKPQKVIWELRKAIAPDAFVVTEVGQNQMWAAHFMRLRHPSQFVTSGGMGTMGFGFPASIGVKYAHRDKQVVDVAGDGSFQMVFQELATAMSEDLPVVVCLLNNGWLGMVKQWQKLMWNRRYCGTELRNNPDFVKLAEAFGAGGMTITRPSELADGFRAAFASDVPFVLDIRTDPEEDMLPMVPGGVSSIDGTIRNRCRWNQDAR